MYDDIVKQLRDAAKMSDALAVLLPHSEGNATAKLYKEAADAIEELSKRETPMRVRITTSTKRCPSCNKQLSGRENIHSNYRFCRWCGQALDWTEPPKEETE